MLSNLRRRLGLDHQLLRVAAEVGALLSRVPLHASGQQPGHHQNRRGQGDPGAGRSPSRCLLGNTKGGKEDTSLL